MAPLVLDWGRNLTRTLLVSPYACGNARVRAPWRRHRGAVIAAGLLRPLS